MIELQLTIPAQDSDNRSMRLKPREVREWLDNLPYMDLHRTLQLVNQQLRLLNRQVITPSARLEILDAFLATYQRLNDSTPGDTASAAALQQQLKLLCQNIAFGYKITVHNLVNGKVRLFDARHLPQSLLGAIHTLGLQLVHYYAHYQQVPRAVWNECLSLYRYASVTGRDQHTGRLATGEPVSISDAFRHIALLKMADPYQLRPGMIAALQQYLKTHIALTALATDSEQKKPGNLLRMVGQPAGETPIAIGIEALLRQIRSDIERLDTHKHAYLAGVSRDIPAATLLGALQKIHTRWQHDQQRAAREKTDAGVEVVTGLDAAYCMVNRGRPFDASRYLDGEPEEPIERDMRGGREPSAPSLPVTIHCTSNDRSSGGLGISYRGKMAVPQVGQLLAIRRSSVKSGGWVLAVFRWLSAPGSAAGFDAGVQYLAGEPLAVVIRPIDAAGFGGAYQPALAATQRRGQQRVQTLVARGKQLQTGDSFTLVKGGEQQRARCIELLETGQGFDRFIYQLLD